MPNLSPQETLDRVIAFHRDLCTYRNRMKQYELARAESRNTYGPRPVMPSDLEDLRQVLLRRAGEIGPICDRFFRILQPQPFRMGPDLDAWSHALYPNDHYSQAHFAGVIADSINEMIGRLESGPSLLDSPQPPEGQRLRSPGMPSQIVNVHGGNVNIAQTAAANIVQSTTGGNIDDLHRRLVDLTHAIDQLAAPSEERESLAAPIVQASTEIGKPKPVLGRLMAGLAAVKTIADTSNQLWDGWDKVQHIAAEVAPRLNDVVQLVAANRILPS